MCTLKYDSGSDGRKDWIVEETRFSPQILGKCESIFAQGNGYMGLRAALEEAYVGEKRDLFVNGTFNRFDSNEAVELPNIPDITRLNLFINGVRFHLASGKIRRYTRSLCLKTGELMRRVEWESPSGDRLALDFKRIVSLSRHHVIAQSLEIVPLSGGLEIKVESGIDATVTNTGSQHFSEGEKRLIDKKILEMTQQTSQSHVTVSVHTAHNLFLNGVRAECSPFPIIDRRSVCCSFAVQVPKDSVLTFEKISTVHTSRDMEFASREQAGQDMEPSLNTAGAAEVAKALAAGYDRLKDESAAEWSRFWRMNDITLTCKAGFDQLSLRFALYHLNIMYGDGDNRLGIGAKGLSGEGYKGHSFWDTEIFILPYFLFTKPQNARQLLEYRYLCAAGARRKAAENGYRGWMYPWESAWIDDGEVTPLWGAVDIVTGQATPILTGQLEQHVTADIAFVVNEYFEATNDDGFMKKYGYEMILGTAEFWASRVQWNSEARRYEICNVIGPDEYKEHADNNAYTNYMAYTNMMLAQKFMSSLKTADADLYKKLSKKFDLPALSAKIKEVAANIYLPQPRKETGIIPQDDTYLSKPEVDLEKYKNAESVGIIYNDYSMEQINGIQVSKQADIVLLLYLLEDLFDLPTRSKNYEYYEKRTLHDSSLSMAMHSMAANRLGRRGEAYRFFQKACLIDLGPAMNSSNQGIHAASMGGIWQDAIFGFGGVRISEGQLSVDPQLPEAWEKMEFRISWRGTTLAVELSHGHMEIVNEGEAPVNIFVGGTEYRIDSKCRFFAEIKA